MQSIKPAILKQWIEEGASFQLFDLRESNEFNHSHLPKAIWLPKFKILRGEIESVDIDRRIVMYCKRGITCSEPAVIMAELGCKEVYCLEGGLYAWKAEIEPDFDIFEYY